MGDSRNKPDPEEKVFNREDSTHEKNRAKWKRLLRKSKKHQAALSTWEQQRNKPAAKQDKAFYQAVVIVFE